MSPTLDPQAAKFLADVGRIQARIARASDQATSGKRIMVASDAPDEIGALLQLRSDIQHNTQIQSNLALAQTDANAADDALSASIKLLDTAVTLAAQGANDTMDANGRAGLAQQIDAIRQQMVANSQTSVQGRFIFSGDNDGSPAYTWDSTAADPVVPVSVSQATRLIEDPAGGAFAASKTAQEIFDHKDSAGDPASDNVFNALSQLEQALQNNDTAAITSSVTLVKAASDHLNSMESFYGNVENRIQHGTDFATKYAVQLQTEVMQKEDADITAVALELTQSNTQLQAAFQVRAQLPHSSLFNYLG